MMVPLNTRFCIPYITAEQVKHYMNKLDFSKIIKLAASCLSPPIAALINKSLATGQFPFQLRQTKTFPIFRDGS